MRPKTETRAADGVAPRYALATTLCLAIGLTGCGDKKPDPTASVAAGGQILPRSISDDMLPYDTVKSEAAPMAPASGAVAAHDRANAREEAALPADEVDDDPAVDAEPEEQTIEQ